MQVQCQKMGVSENLMKKKKPLWIRKGKQVKRKCQCWYFKIHIGNMGKTLVSISSILAFLSFTNYLWYCVKSSWPSFF